MALFSIVPQGELAAVLAQATGRTRNKAAQARMTEYDDAVRSIQPGEVLRLDLEEGATARGEFLRIARASKRVGIDTEAFEVDGTIYIQLSKPEPVAVNENGEVIEKPKRQRKAVEQAA